MASGEPCGTISLKALPGALRLIYSVPTNELRILDYAVLLTRTPCHFGGSRVWFTCPANGCGSRVAKLYLMDSHFLCRHCAHLTYASQSRGPGTRACFRAFRIQRRLGGETGAAYGLPEKPNGMHWRTYERLCVEYFLAVKEDFKNLGDARSRILSR